MVRRPFIDHAISGFLSVARADVSELIPHLWKKAYRAVNYNHISGFLLFFSFLFSTECLLAYCMIHATGF
jgi:hypothetical protein